MTLGKTDRNTVLAIRRKEFHCFDCNIIRRIIVEGYLTDILVIVWSNLQSVHACVHSIVSIFNIVQALGDFFQGGEAGTAKVGASAGQPRRLHPLVSFSRLVYVSDDD
jgi:hypothetical protein